MNRFTIPQVGTLIQEKYLTWESIDIDSMDATPFCQTMENSQRNSCTDLWWLKNKNA